MAGMVGGIAGCAVGSATGGAAGGAVDAAKNACSNAPQPDDPQAGLGNVLAPKPPGVSQDPFADPNVGIYQRYGYGGYQLPVYVADEGPAGCVRAVAAGPGSFIANTLLDGMVWVISIGGFLNRVGHVHSYWDVLDPAVESAALLAQRLLWADNGVLSLAIGVLACVALWRGMKGHVSIVINIAATALFVLFLGNLTAFKAVESTHWVRDRVTGLTDMFHAGNGEGEAGSPASDVVQRELLYRTWAAAMFGDADGPAAKEYGPRLFDCMTWRWDEPQTNELLERKQGCTRQLMGELSKKYTVANDYARGDKTGQQAGTAFLGFLAALFVAGWEIIAGLAGLVLNAICTFIVPAVAFTVPFALFKAGLKHLRHLGELLVGAGIKAAVCSVVAQLVAAAEGAVLGAGAIPWILKIIFMVLIVVLAWMFTKRHRRLVNGAVDRKVSQAANLALKGAELAAAGAAAGAGMSLPGGISENFPGKKGKKGKTGRDDAAAAGAGAATAEKAVPETSRDGWVAPALALPAGQRPSGQAGRRRPAEGTVAAGQPPLAWEHDATGPAPGPGTYQRADGSYATADTGARPVAALGPGRFALPAGTGTVHDPAIHTEQHRRLVEAMNGVDPVDNAPFDRQLTGVYVADRRGQPFIDVNGWVAPSPSPAGATRPTVTPSPVSAAASRPTPPPPPAPPVTPRPVRPMPGPTPPSA